MGSGVTFDTTVAILVLEDLVGLALRGPKKDVDKATKGSSLHP